MLRSTEKVLHSGLGDSRYRASECNLDWKSDRLPDVPNRRPIRAPPCLGAKMNRVDRGLGQHGLAHSKLYVIASQR